MGLSFGPPKVEMPKMQAWKAGIVTKLTGGVKQLVKGSGTQYVTATAEILGPGRVKLSYPEDKPDDIVECEHLVIATGSVPIEIPGFAVDQNKVRDSTGMLDLDFVPEELVCIGGGIIERFPETYIYAEGTKGFLELGPDFWIRETTEDGTLAKRYPPPRYAWADPAYDVVHSSIVPAQVDIAAGLRGDQKAETDVADNIKTVRLVFRSYEAADQQQMLHLD